MKDLIEKLERKSNSHKGQNGKVGVIGGSKDYSGAPALNAEAALRTGSDLVNILTSETVRDVVRSYSENFIVQGFESDYFGNDALGAARELSEWADAVVLGSGLSKPEGKALKNLAEKSESPLVVDADAIEPIATADFGKAVFTPHEAEAEFIREKFGSLENFAEEKETVVVLKGEEDRIYTPEEKFVNDTGHPTMTVGGTGDVMAGIIGALISQGLEISEAARLGAWINGKAGEKAAEELGKGALTTDIVEQIPGVLTGEE